ncbi:HAMP domain-containing sensor histidine kinase [Luteimonas huabeiensis]|uniref:sensor histidine kinase n=1 Tax=Luteimonas huabeiensis TaxID=1244513 RepID=UPI002B26F45E|nr:HAMP domain-containing sensor histidine kinase [Luteimonas huabeiensis]
MPARYGFEAYISVPIRRPDGRFFGTLCALDPRPLEIDPTILRNMELLAQLIGLQLESEDRLQRAGTALAESERIARLREEFIAVLGHDLRSPLQAIVTSAELLGHYGLGPRQQQLAELILRSATRMEEMVRATLDFARGRLGGGIALDLSQHDRLEALLEQVVEEAGASYPERRIETRIELGAPVVCDPYRLSQLLSNLVANALCHGDPDAPVRIEADRHDGVLRLSVHNGGAIPADRIPDLFQPFTRRDDDARPGLGLGLYIAAEIARAHGGTLEVDSAPERGTRFTFRLPPIAAPSPAADTG